MFVTKGAKQTVRKKRRDAFYDNFIRSLLTEAASLEISEEELIEMIRRQSLQK